MVLCGGSAQDGFAITSMGLDHLVEAVGRIYTPVTQAIIASDNGLPPGGTYKRT